MAEINPFESVAERGIRNLSAMPRRSGTLRETKLKKLPILRTDRQAEAFIANSDLSQYDLSGLRPVEFEFGKKSARISMRLPEPLLAAVKRRASSRGIPYQRFIRETVEKAVAQSR